MHSKPFPRYLGGAWRLLLCALLVAALGPVAGPVPARAGGVAPKEAEILASASQMKLEAMGVQAPGSIPWYTPD